MLAEGSAKLKLRCGSSSGQDRAIDWPERLAVVTPAIASAG